MIATVLTIASTIIFDVPSKFGQYHYHSPIIRVGYRLWNLFDITNTERVGFWLSISEQHSKSGTIQCLNNHGIVWNLSLHRPSGHSQHRPSPDHSPYRCIGVYTGHSSSYSR